MALIGKFTSLGFILTLCLSASIASGDECKASGRLGTSECMSIHMLSKAIEDENGQHGLHLLQVRGSDKFGNGGSGTYGNGCPTPDVQKEGVFSAVGKACPTPGNDPETWTESCLDGNRGYLSLWDAWEKCGLTEECGAVMDYGNGLYYLRRASDPDDPAITNAKLFVYACEAKAEEEEEIREAARLEADEEIKQEHKARSSVLKEQSVLKDNEPIRAIKEAQRDIESAMRSAEDAAESAKLATESAWTATHEAESAVHETKEHADMNQESEEDVQRAAESAHKATNEAQASNSDAESAAAKASRAMAAVDRAANLAEENAERETEEAAEKMQIASQELVKWGKGGGANKAHRKDMTELAAKAIHKAMAEAAKSNLIKAKAEAAQADSRKAKVEETMEDFFNQGVSYFKELEEERETEEKDKSELQKAEENLASIAEGGFGDSEGGQ